MMAAIEKAQQIGTYGKDDRSLQYPLDSSQKVIEAVNLALTKSRKCERELEEKKKELFDLKQKLRSYRVVNIALTSIITGLAWEGLKLVIPMVLWWLGF